MSIPLDRLYHFLEDLCGEDIIIYRWYPHGSKKLSDFEVFKNSNTSLSKFDSIIMPIMIMHDQEPLNYNYYSYEEILSVVKEQAEARKHLQPKAQWCDHNDLIEQWAHSHLRTKILHPFNLHDLIILCHSEKNSKQLELYEQNGYIGVYYWSHALIARDWFRYAQHDSRLWFDSNLVTNDFLIYNRAWQGSREYRLKFAELLLDNNLLTASNIKFNPVDNNEHYTKHNFKNPDLKINRVDLEKHIPLNTSQSFYSADYDSSDYNACGIEVILETLFDDTANHLTEKTLRAVACGKPFILASTPGSLQYFKEYGFKTFDGLIDETYDTITDPLQRLQAIITEMTRLSSLDFDKKKNLWNKLHEIARFNKNHFFAEYFYDTIVNEFVSNFKTALEISKNNVTGKWWYFLARNPKFDKLIVNEFTQKIDSYLQEINKSKSV